MLNKRLIVINFEKNMESSNPLKIKLKLGNRSNSPSVPTYQDGESEEEVQESLNMQV